ncbi:MAG: M13 family metallopeptidase N-terminal domain-containing protein, partial [Micropepsaceae bacterium]
MSLNVNRRAMLLGAGAASLAAMGAGAWTMAARAAAGKPAIGAWGLDLAAMDKSVSPGDDFFRHVGGTWMKTTHIPSDRSRWGSFNILAAKSEDDVRTVLDDARRKKPAAGSVERKALDYYESYNDTAAIDRKGLAPAKADLDRIVAVQTHEDLVVLLSGPEFRANAPVGMGVNLDAKRPDTYVIGIGQSGLGMPDRDYYLKDDVKFADTRTKYRAYVEQLLTLAGYPDAATSAGAIVAVERQIAEIHWPREKSRNRDLTYNPKTRAELLAFAPEFPWEAGLAAFGAPTHDFFIVTQVDAIQALAKLFRATPVSTWRAYVTFHYLNGLADVLPKAFDDAGAVKCVSTPGGPSRGGDTSGPAQWTAADTHGDPPMVRRQRPRHRRLFVGDVRMGRRPGPDPDCRQVRTALDLLESLRRAESGMQVDWALVTELLKLVGAGVGALIVRRVLERRSSLVTYYGHVASHRIDGSPPISVGTHSVIIRNAGRLPAKNVRVAHTTLPPNIDMYPRLEHHREAVPNSADN